MRTGALRAIVLLGAFLASACSTTYTNKPSGPQEQPVRATFDVDGKRGNPRVLTYLAISGGGSRSAFFSTAVMLNLQTAFPDIDLLEEVDVMSSVSGGSLAAAYYAGTQDRFIYDRVLAAAVALLPADSALGKKLTVADAKIGAVGCSGELTDTELGDLRTLDAPPKSIDRAAALCASRALGLRYWEPAAVRDGMSKDYLLPWFGRWFLPTNFFPYWFSSLDRSDIMAQTFASNLFSKGLFNTELKMGDLNPSRPYLLVNATAATQRDANDDVGKDDPPFGTTFTFTAQDFKSRLGSRIDEYSVARAVMGSSAFPVVFQNMTLADHRPNHAQHCKRNPESSAPCSEQRYFHIFDGGNADNLGLHSVKRSILERAMKGEIGSKYDAIVVILIDAITEAKGADRFSPDPRGFFSLIADLNVTDAVDALLKGNHDKMIGEFMTGLGWESPCRPDVHNLPTQLCTDLLVATAGEGRAKALKDSINDRLVFMHIGFDNVLQVPGVDKAEARKLLNDANAISTSFNLRSNEAHVLQRHADLIVAANNECLEALRDLYLHERPDIPLIAHAKDRCIGSTVQDPLKTKAPMALAP